MPSEDCLRRKIREWSGVRSRPGKRRISHTEDHAKKRFEQGLAWSAYAASWWEKDIHAYIDSKKCVCPRNEADKKLLRATRVTHHLRTPSEGTETGFVLPKRNHMLLGVPSIEVTAALAYNRVIMWHVSEKPWNGAKAAAMYAELGKGLAQVPWQEEEVSRS